ncbi:hypothetical protein K466DRAFT_446761, partial [Polyporus arcularius HHB13444]
RLQQTWTAPIYAFFSPDVTIGYNDVGRRYHAFRCNAKPCKGRQGSLVHRYLDTSDAKSTGNLRRHAKNCWGIETVERADDADDADEVRATIAKAKKFDGSITAHFARKKGAVTYSHRQHTKAETRLTYDRAFQSLMKTGRPSYYLPSASTCSCDAKNVFKGARGKVAKILREYEGKVSFATDAWTSPNHRAYMAVTAHLEHKGEPLCFLLDLVEVAKSHTGVNLATAF